MNQSKVLNENNNVELSIVVPVYNGTLTIMELYKRIVKVSSSLVKNFQIVLVDDRSLDNSWLIMKEISYSDKRVYSLRLSRNFGQHSAITAGLKHAFGDWIVVMDCDLQDRPEEIKKLFEARNGVGAVLALRDNRKDHFYRKFNSWIFYEFFNYFTNTKLDYRIANFGIYSKSVIQNVLLMNDYIKYFPAMIQWVGYDKKIVIVEHDYRQGGRSNYSFARLLILAYENIVAFSEKPLKFSVVTGFFITLVSCLIWMYYLVLYFSGTIKVLGFTSLIFSVWFLGGVILFYLGILGIYLGKTFVQSKNRPVFIVEECVNGSL